MNAEAILTPGGIADQLGRSLSGVAQAYADYNNQKAAQAQQDIVNNRESARMALEQQRYAQQQDRLQQQDARQALMDSRNYASQQHVADQRSASAALAQQLGNYRLAETNPRAYTNGSDPALAQYAQSKLNASQFKDATQGYVDPRDIQNTGPQGEQGPFISSPSQQGLSARKTLAAERPNMHLTPEQRIAELEAKYGLIAKNKEEADTRKNDVAAAASYVKAQTAWKRMRASFLQGAPSPEELAVWESNNPPPTDPKAGPVVPVDREAVKNNIVTGMGQFITK
jgi:hypothetical protein